MPSRPMGRPLGRLGVIWRRSPGFSPRGAYSVLRGFKVEEQDHTRGARREEKSRKKRKMKVVGGSVRLLHRIIGRRAEEARDTERRGP